MPLRRLPPNSGRPRRVRCMTRRERINCDADTLPPPTCRMPRRLRNSFARRKRVMSRPRTFGELQAAGHRPRTVKDEMRANLITRLRTGGALFPGIVGYESTVEPQIVNAILSRHDFILLGLRGQAKTRLLRSLTQFLDEWIPAVEGCPLNSDPGTPLTHHARALKI